MNTKKSIHITLLFFVLHVIVSYAGMLRIYGPYTMSEVSAKYTHLLTPAGFTFAIWGIIYLALALQLAFHWRAAAASQVAANSVWNAMGLRLAITHAATIVWCICWCNGWVLLANIFIIVQLVCLVQALLRVSTLRTTRSVFWFSTVPLAIYTGWLCIATVANTASSLVAYVQVSLPEESVAKMVLLSVALITVGTVFYTRQIAFTLPIIWAFWGIYKAPQNLAHPSVQYALVAAIVIIAAANILVGWGMLQRYRLANK